MYIYAVHLKGEKEPAVFMTDSWEIPDNYLRFYDEHEDEVEDTFCDHWPCTIAEFMAL